MNGLAHLGRLGKFLVIACVRFYQRGISPLIGPRCRFNPTCSHYMIAAIEKHGLMRGVGKGLKRIARCHPWNPGGYDPP